MKGVKSILLAALLLLPVASMASECEVLSQRFYSNEPIRMHTSDMGYRKLPPINLRAEVVCPTLQSDQLLVLDMRANWASSQYVSSNLPNVFFEPVAKRQSLCGSPNAVLVERLKAGESHFVIDKTVLKLFTNGNVKQSSQEHIQFKQESVFRFCPA